MLDTMSHGELATHKFQLSQPNVVTDEHGTNGTWTMIYDEGFEVTVSDKVFFAFSKFAWIDGPKGKTNVSQCDRTQVGWFRNKARTQWGCYVGTKTEAAQADADNDDDDEIGDVPADVSSSDPTTTTTTSKKLKVRLLQSQQLLHMSDNIQSDDDAEDDGNDKSSSDEQTKQATSTATTTTTSLDDSEGNDAGSSDEQSSTTTTTSLDDSEGNDASSSDEQSSTTTTISLDDTAIQQVQTSLVDSEGDDDSSSDEQTTTQTTTTTTISLDDPESLGSLTAPKVYQAWVPDGGNGYQKPMESAWVEKVADALNFMQLGWTAASYQMFHGKTPQEVNRFAGVRRHRSSPKGQTAAGLEPAGDLSFLSVASKSRHARRHKASAGSLDWRSKDGKNWITPVVNQGDCGSCYTISTVHMFTARNKIRSGSPDGPLFSMSFPLYCAEYNQGCDGGYGFLQSKWSEDVGLVPEECVPFSTGGGSCKIASDCDLGGKRYRATNHHYVGGFYGNTDAEAVRRELVSGGPVVMSFEPTEDFMYYKAGVYRSVARKIHEEWEQVDHAVLLVGYGGHEINGNHGQEYWTMQNSWGSDWGEEGFFRMVRGTDESGCESIVVSADVVEEDSNSVLDAFVHEFKGN